MNINKSKFVYPGLYFKNGRLFPKKKLGQNFLTDPEISSIIIKAAGLTEDDFVLEIGPGLGALTFPIANISKMVFAVERDQDMIDLLENELKNQDIKNVKFFNKDILKFDIYKNIIELNKINSEINNNKIIVMGNLPYNISSQIAIKLINERKYITKAVLMFQKEMAKRIAASPGNKDYGRLSVIIQYFADIEFILEISGKKFYPRVEVDSEVIMLKFKKNISFKAVDEKFFFLVVKAAFSQRRKILKNSLSSGFLPFSSDRIDKALKESDIDSQRRAETLNVNEFVKLSNAFSKP